MQCCFTPPLQSHIHLTVNKEAIERSQKRRSTAPACCEYIKEACESGAIRILKNGSIVPGFRDDETTSDLTALVLRCCPYCIAVLDKRVTAKTLEPSSREKSCCATKRHAVASGHFVPPSTGMSLHFGAFVDGEGKKRPFLFCPWCTI